MAGRWLAILSAVAALAAVFYFLAVPVYQTQEISSELSDPQRGAPPDVERRSGYLLEREGLKMAAVLAFPVAVAGVTLFFRRRRSAVIARTAAALLVFMFVGISILTVGRLFIPSALLMMASALLAAMDNADPMKSAGG